MADRSVKVRLDADVSGFTSAMSTAGKATVDFAKRANDAGKRGLDWVGEHKASINDLSNAALGLGAGLVAGAGLATKAAMDWETAWVGVTKTVDGTDEQMASLEAGLRNMAKELPATHTEIAAVAEAAGQLGVAVPDIESFTRTMIDLGESTNLTSEEAATSLARFMNVMGTSQDEVSNLGSAVVGLGNNFETTESEIVALSMRLAGASAQAGLTEGDVLGLATAMSSVGIEAEAGGSAMSLTMKRIGKAVDEGGASLEMFSRVAGMTTEEFATAWETRPTEALDAFIAGLKDTQDFGMSTNAVLTELGITGIRESDALLRLSAASEQGADGMSLLARTVEMGNEAYSENIALTEEAANKYATAESKIAMMRNAFVDLGIDIGGAVAPALSDAAESVSYLIDKFQDLPDWAKSALGMGAGIGGMALLAVGGLGKALVAVSDLNLAVKGLGTVADTTGKKLKLLGIGSGAALAVTALALAIGHFVSEAAEADALADQLVDSFDELTGAATVGTDQLIFDALNESINKTKWDKLKELGITYEEVVDAVKEGGPALDELNDKIFKLETGLSRDQKARGYKDALKALRREVDDTAGAYELSREKLALQEDQMGDTSAATDEAAEAAARAAAGQEVLEAAVEETGVALDGTIEKLSEFLDLLFATGLATMSARDAQAAYHESVSEVDDAIKEINESMGGMGKALNKNKTDFDLTTEAGRTANSAFQDIAKSGMDLTKAMAENGATQDELQGSLNRTYDDLVRAGQGMGLTESAARDLAREVLGIPDGVDIETWMSDEAERQAEATKRAVDNITRSVTVTTRFVTQGSPPKVSAPGTRTATVYADGGIREPSLMAFASGSENHVAQIAGAGEMRLWAEPETGGEAYIPLAQSKRARSERILEDVAGRFGMRLSKFANGDVRSPSYIPRAGVQGGQAVDYAAIGAAVNAAMSSWQPMVKLGNREIAGVMVQGRQSARAFGGL